MAYESATHDGMTVESSSQTADQIREAFEIPDAVVETAPPADAVDAPPAEVKPNPRKDPRARVEQATATAAEAKRERDEAKAEAAELKTRLAALEARQAPKVEPTKPVLPPVEAKPTVDQFDNYEDFVEARARWASRQEWNEREQLRLEHQASQAREHTVREVDRQFSERYNAVLAEDPDFPSKVDPRLLNTPRSGVLKDPSQATFGNFLVERVFKAAHPKEMLLHLSDIATVQRLATLPPDEVIGELAYFDRSIGAASPSGPAPIAPPVSKAKAPIQPLGSSHVTAPDAEPGDDAPIEQHIKYWNNAEKKQKRA